METLANPQAWAEYGVLGLFAFALIVGIAYLHRDNRRERSEARNEHREERREWRETSDKLRSEDTDKLSRALDGLERAIRDSVRQ